MSRTLHQVLAEFSYSQLTNFSGDQTTAALAEFGALSTRKQYAEVLSELRGSELFRDAHLRGAVIDEMTEEELEQIRSEIGAAGDSDQALRTRLSKSTWADNQNAAAIVRVFGLELAAFLPDPAQTTSVAAERVVPELSAQQFRDDPTLHDYRMYPLHAYQKRVKDDCIQELLPPGSRLLMQMPTGAGKTKTAIEALVDFWRVQGRNSGHIVWLAHTRELCEQAYEQFANIWKARGDTEITMCRVFEDFAPTVSDTPSGICFAGFQKMSGLIRRTDPLAMHLRDSSRLVVVDEAHKALAPDYSKSIEYLTSGASTRLLGLTATPGRSSNPADFRENERFKRYFGNEIVRISYPEDKFRSEMEFLQDNRFLARLERIEVDSNVTFTPDELSKIDPDMVDLPVPLLEKLSANATRNALILMHIRKAVKEREDATLVFATSKPHAIVLRQLLANDGIHAECVFGDTPRDARRSSIAAFKANQLPVLINYSVLTTGFDAPNLGTLVIARPTSSVILYSQMLGRALRGPRMGGMATTNTVVDLVDNRGRFGSETAAYHFFDGYWED